MSTLQRKGSTAAEGRRGGLADDAIGFAEPRLRAVHYKDQTCCSLSLLSTLSSLSHYNPNTLSSINKLLVVLTIMTLFGSKKASSQTQKEPEYSIQPAPAVRGFDAEFDLL